MKEYLIQRLQDHCKQAINDYLSIKNNPKLEFTDYLKGQVDAFRRIESLIKLYKKQ